MALSPKMVINYSRAYEKILHKGEPYRFSGSRDPSVHRERQRPFYYIEKILIHRDFLKPILIFLSLPVLSKGERMRERESKREKEQKRKREREREFKTNMIDFVMSYYKV